MRWLLYLLVAPLSALGIVTGLAAIHPPLALTPVIDTSNSSAPRSLPGTITSIENLYQLRDRLQRELEQSSETLIAVSSGDIGIPPNPLQLLQALEIRIQVEEAAKESWDQAIRSAIRAQELAAISDTSVEHAEEVYTHWNQAVQSLQEISETSLLGDEAAKKLEEYQPHLERAAYNYDTARSEFLQPIAEATGLPLSDVMITVCHLSGECRRLNGDQRPASPASLIKVPVAIALMDKVTSEGIDIRTKIRISYGNYTEDASDVWIGSEYTLWHIMTRMINQSSNIATNQLIDYVGRDYIRQVMRDRGYTKTVVDSKLVGEQTYPSDLGSVPNEITTDELTEMMRDIYNNEHPGDEVLMEALMSQYDQALGYDGLRPTRAIWMGEKTGQNSDAIGTTVAFRIDEETYILSLVLNYTASEYAMRQVIRDIANHIDQQGQL